MTEAEKIEHLLNRLAYGPRPGDIERVREIGIRAWIERQLHPERIPDPVAEEKLARYSILDMSLEELAAHDRPATQRAVRRRESVVQRVERLDGEDPGRATGTRASAPAPRDGTGRTHRTTAFLNPSVSSTVTEMDRPRAFEIIDTRLLRAVYSERQLQEVMVDFWVNHFNIFVGDPYLVADFEDNVVRPHALGSFHDLLVGTATHPAMLLYLDNWLSTAPAEVVRERLEAGAPIRGVRHGTARRALALRERSSYLDQARGLNENYARELMELHTVGVEGGYTQQDVIEVAKCFTGWTVSGPRASGEFLFDPTLHVRGPKVVMGETIDAGGMKEGLQVLDMLAHHPSTAHFISWKLVRKFVSDEPPEGLVEEAASTFMETDGEIRAVLRTIFTSPEFFAREHFRSKVKKPIELVASALRAVGAEMDLRFDNSIGALNETLEEMGEPLYEHEAPDGYPEVGSAWVSTNVLYQRLDFAVELAAGRIPGVEVDLDSAESLFERLSIGRPAPEQVAQVQRLLRNAEGPATGGNYAAMMMSDPEPEADTEGGAMEPATGESDEVSAAEARAIAVAFALGAPRFQKQ